MQSYASHAHHPVPTYIASALWLASAVALGGARLAGWDSRDLSLVFLLAAVFVTISIGRLYTTRLQDRIIMLEMKVRCAEVLPAGDDLKLGRLGPKQIAALRFASDEELGPLLDRAVNDRLSPDAIKRAVTTWRPDPYRT